ncbi:MAG TPA: PQQ-dependent sugar dehydrogenase [Steroidobacteraceae bacterium]|nr:PQQ-dependent sugar dehydrogenase [Steroidobacteraceae bacterium]
MNTDSPGRIAHPPLTGAGHLPPWGFLLAWHLLAFVLLLLLSGLKTHLPLWSPVMPDRPIVMALGYCYLISVLLLLVSRFLGRPVNILQALCVTLAVFGVEFVYLVLTRAEISGPRSALLGMVGAAVILVTLGFVLRRLRVPALAALALAVIAVAGFEVYRTYRPKQPPMSQSVSNINTGFYTLHAVTYANALPPSIVRGGGIALIGNEYLLATGDGRFYVFDWRGPQDNTFSIRPLPYRAPLNAQEFRADVKPGVRPDNPDVDMNLDQQQGVQTWQFRVADVRVMENGDNVRVFVSHHYWKHARKCFVVRVSSLSGRRADFLAGAAGLHWETVFESTPCVPLTGPDSLHANNPFSGMEIGGRLFPLDDHTLMLTLGDHDFSGIETKAIFAQDPQVSYGKTILLHLDTGTSEIYSLGHRNPQGLYITPQGTIWSTEHGPQGGDELNHIVQGANYGWPMVTYGTDYGSAAWPLNRTQGRHDGYQQPTYVWLPSIGVSNLIRIERDRFPIWKGDLLVASLHGHALFRIRLLDDRVVYAEPIPIGERLRDLIEGPDGRIVLWTDASNIVSLTPAQGTDGAVLFAMTCGACHKAIDGYTQSYGPDLSGVVGRKVASAPGFQGYSPALKSLHGAWTKERLDEFLSAPQKMVPGTTMTFRGIPDASQRSAIVDYLAGLEH